jgi:hypothetical protein
MRDSGAIAWLRSVSLDVRVPVVKWGERLSSGVRVTWK